MRLPFVCLPYPSGSSVTFESLTNILLGYTISRKYLDPLTSTCSLMIDLHNNLVELVLIFPLQRGGIAYAQADRFTARA